MTLPEIAVFDSMTGAKRTLEPVTRGKIGLYVCGVTVYDLTHIGHARVFVSFDVVSRYLRHRGYEVTYVRNHTDVDDKIINRAAENGEDALVLAQRFIEALDSDMGRLGCLAPDVEPRVSTHIPQIIAMVEQLIERGHAYAVGGDVFFDVSSDDDYGKLSKVDLDANRDGERIAVDTRKRSPRDFALWKAQKPGEISWDSPWGEGRPGWHIECSAMSTTYLGDTFDIHGGGKDLVFPHHENEIAQSECATGHPFANNWMHVGLLNIDGEKMSKSLNNFWTVRDVLERYHPEIVRWFFLSGHYRKPVGYCDGNLDLARHRLQYHYVTRESLGALWQRVERPAPDSATLEGWLGEFYKAMDDDFNTCKALSVVGEIAKVVNELLPTKKIGKKADVLGKLAAAEAVFDVVGEALGVLGEAPAKVLTEIRDQLAVQLEVDIDAVANGITARNAAREAKDWAEGDRIRDELLAQHVVLMDGPEGTIWRIEPPAPAGVSSPAC
jgi:cysteinyl-tRNA synthetase